MQTHTKQTFTSPAAPSTQAVPVVVGAEWRDLDQFDEIFFIEEHLGGTGGVHRNTIQTSYDGGVTWFDWYRSADIAAASAAGVRKICMHPETSAVTAIGKHAVEPAAHATIAKGSIVPGRIGDRARVVCETDVSVSAGAAQAITMVGRRH